MICCETCAWALWIELNTLTMHRIQTIGIGTRQPGTSLMAPALWSTMMAALCM